MENSKSWINRDCLIWTKILRVLLVCKIPCNAVVSFWYTAQYRTILYCIVLYCIIQYRPVQYYTSYHNCCALKSRMSSQYRTRSLHRALKCLTYCCNSKTIVQYIRYITIDTAHLVQYISYSTIYTVHLVQCYIWPIAIQNFFATILKSVLPSTY